MDVLFEFLPDGLVGVHGGGMIAASEIFSDLPVARSRHFPAEEHGDLPNSGDRPPAGRSTDVA